jgi:hypothetical protein
MMAKHIALKCISDPTIDVGGYVHHNELKRI